MEFKTLSSSNDIAAAARLAALSYEHLQFRLPFLPARTEKDFAHRIERISGRGVVLGIFETDKLTAYLGALPVDNFRNSGPGYFGPDWCHGTITEADPASTIRQLYRELAPRLISLGARIHAFGFYDSDSEMLHAMALTGFGRIVIDAARPTKVLLDVLQHKSNGIEIYRAGTRDAQTLSRLEAVLAKHIESAPVFMPNKQARNPDAWTDWLLNPSHIVLLARKQSNYVGFIKAEAPQFDVTYAVHDPSTLAINGMYVDAESRREGVGMSLLQALVQYADSTGKQMVSVDFETTNLEAYGFWTRWFTPVSWCVERRV